MEEIPRAESTVEFIGLAILDHFLLYFEKRIAVFYLKPDFSILLMNEP
jgi:hypothetical protein